MNSNLSSLTLINTQTHKRFEASFTAGFNCIYADNNRGKSTIVRCWDMLNNNIAPAKDGICRRVLEKGKVVQQTASIKAVFDDGNIVKRVKGKDDNTYEVNGKVLTDVGRGVPQEVKDILGFSTLFDDVSENIFIRTDEDTNCPIITGVSSTAGKILNELVGVEEYEIAIAEFNKEKRGLNSEIKFIEKEHEDVTLQLAGFKGLNKIIRLVKEAEIEERQIGDIDDRLSMYENLKKEYDKAEYNYKRIMFAIADFDVSKFEDIVKENDELADTEKLIVILENCKKTFDYHVNVTMKTKSADKLIDTVMDDNKEYTSLLERTESMCAVRTLYMTAVSRLDAVRIALNDNTVKLKKFAGTNCPTCNKVMTEKDLIGK